MVINNKKNARRQLLSTSNINIRGERTESISYEAARDHLIRMHGSADKVHNWQPGQRKGVWGTLAEVWPQICRWDKKEIPVWCSVGVADPYAACEGNARGIVSVPLYYYLDDDRGSVPKHIRQTCGWVVYSGGITADGKIKKHIYIPVPQIENDSRTEKEKFADYLIEGKKWAVQLGTDPAVHELSRVTRLSGLSHFKTGRRPVTFRGFGDSTITLDPDLPEVPEYNAWYKLSELLGLVEAPTSLAKEIGLSGMVDRYSAEWRVQAPVAKTYLQILALSTRGVNSLVTKSFAVDGVLRSFYGVPPERGGWKLTEKNLEWFRARVLVVVSKAVAKHPVPQLHDLSAESASSYLLYMQAWTVWMLMQLEKIKNKEKFKRPSRKFWAPGPDSVWWVSAQDDAAHWLNHMDDFWDGKASQQCGTRKNGEKYSYVNIAGIKFESARRKANNTQISDQTVVGNTTLGAELSRLRSSGRTSTKVQCPSCHGGDKDAYLNTAGTLVCFRETITRRIVSGPVLEKIQVQDTDGLDRDHEYIPERIESIMAVHPISNKVGAPGHDLKSIADKRVVFVCHAGTGTGKGEWVTQLSNRDDFSVSGKLAVASRKSLNGQFALRQGYKSYLDFRLSSGKWDVNGMQHALSTCGLVITPNSLHMVQVPHGCLLILDEYMEIVHTVTHSGTLSKRPGMRESAHTALRNAMASAKYVAVFDAFLTKDAITEAKDACRPDITIAYQHRWTRHKDQTRYFANNLATIKAATKKLWLAGKKLDITVDTQSQAKDLAEWLTGLCPNKIVKVYHGDNSEGLQTEISNLQDRIKTLDALIRSPTISSGHSWTNTGFDVVIGMFTRMGGNASTLSEAIQMMSRDRNLDVPWLIYAHQANIDQRTDTEVSARMLAGQQATRGLLLRKVPGYLRQYKPQDDSLFDSFCRGESRRLAGCNLLRDSLVDFFCSKGGKVVFLADIEASKADKLERAEAHTAWTERECKEILESGPLDHETLERIRRSGTSDPKERTAHKKHQITTFLGDDIEPDLEIVKSYAQQQGKSTAKRFADLWLCIHGKSNVVAAGDYQSTRVHHMVDQTHRLRKCGWAIKLMTDWYRVDPQGVITPAKDFEDFATYLDKPSKLSGFATLRDEIKDAIGIKLNPVKTTKNGRVCNQIGTLGQLLRLFGLALTKDRNARALDWDKWDTMVAHSAAYRERETNAYKNLKEEMRYDARKSIQSWAKYFSSPVALVSRPVVPAMTLDTLLAGDFAVEDLTPAKPSQHDKDHKDWLTDLRSLGPVGLQSKIASAQPSQPVQMTLGDLVGPKAKAKPVDMSAPVPWRDSGACVCGTSPDDQMLEI